MGTLKAPIELSANDLTQRINDVQIGGFAFVGCTVEGDFNYLHFAHSLEALPIHVVPSDQVPPLHAVLTWSGQMGISGKLGPVNVFRDLPGTSSVPLSQPALSPEAASAVSKSVSIESIATISRATVVARAMSAVGTSTQYTMTDTRPPAIDAERWPEDGARIDCSGFVAWCLRMPRKIRHPLYQKVNGGWFETTALYQDGLNQTGFFSSVPSAQPGSLLVYPDKDGAQGHIGVVLEANGAGVQGAQRVVHCSLGSFKKTGKAIQETSAAIWQKRADAIVLDYEGYV